MAETTARAETAEAVVEAESDPAPEEMGGRRTVWLGVFLLLFCSGFLVSLFSLADMGEGDRVTLAPV